MQVVTLGPAGTYSHRAARAVVADRDTDPDEAVAFRESVTTIVAAVADGEFARGVVPVENSIEGAVDETLDAFAEHDVSVVREIVSPIRHALIARSESFETVASHPQALAQCRKFLAEQYPDVTQEAVASTARGVERAREDPTVAAIGHPANADGESLRVVAADIQDHDSNVTRFLVVAPEADRSEAGGKTSLVVYPGVNYPGLLLELLEAFADRDINLSRIESRPSGERLGDYCFHFDIEAGLYESRTEAALADVETICEAGWVRRLGSYDTEHVVD